MPTTQSSLYLPWQFPLMQIGLSPLQELLDPHLHSPAVQVFEVPVHSELLTHSIEQKFKYNHFVWIT